jgi:hypothetical protein
VTSGKILLLQVLIASFFAIGVLRAHGPLKFSKRASLGDIFRLPNRLERLRRSRWQWFSMVLLMLLVRVQYGLPLAVELTAIVQFVVFLALPARVEERSGTIRKWNSYGV